MVHFLWIEDFENNAAATATTVFGTLLPNMNFSEDKEDLKDQFEKHGIFVELSFLEGLRFIRDAEKLAHIDYILLDIDLDVDGGQPDDDNVLESFMKFYDHYENAVDKNNPNIRANVLGNLKKEAGYHLYHELVRIGFPHQHIIFCSNHGDKQKQILESFKKGRVKVPEIYTKDKNVSKWIMEKNEDQYTTLRRGIYEGCHEISQKIEEGGEDSLLINRFTKNERKLSIDDAENYLYIIKSLLPLQIPSSDQNKAKLNLFVKILAYEWEVVDPKELPILPRIMKIIRNWVSHNTTLFYGTDEKFVAYLFIVNMRAMFDFNTMFRDEKSRPYEKILFTLFPRDLNLKNSLNSIDTEMQDAYRALKWHASTVDCDDKHIRFEDLANCIQRSNLQERNNTKLFTQITYRLFWSLLDKKNDFAKTFLKCPPFIREFAEYIYRPSFK